MMAKKLFPEHADCISMALTPMTLTARLIKRHHSNAKVVFIGPCAAKSWRLCVQTYEVMWISFLLLRK